MHPYLLNRDVGVHAKLTSHRRPINSRDGETGPGRWLDENDPTTWPRLRRSFRLPPGDCDRVPTWHPRSSRESEDIVKNGRAAQACKGLSHQANRRKTRYA